jgi:predicted dinucleotide-binding enzyme
VKIGVLGTGTVGQTLGRKLVELGHDVKLGSRQAGNEKAVKWAEEAGSGASEGSFADAASHGELLINATAGDHSVDALQMAGADNLAGKVIIDVSNKLEMREGPLPNSLATDDDSIAEEIQRTFPDARVVKTLNTITAGVMVDPSLVPSAHNIFICGDDPEAKAEATELLKSLGWPEGYIMDLGGIVNARGAEMYVGFWLRLLAALGHPNFNLEIVQAQ